MKLGFVRRDVGQVSKRNELSWLFFFKNHLDVEKENHGWTQMDADHTKNRETSLVNNEKLSYPSFGFIVFHPCLSVSIRGSYFPLSCAQNCWPLVKIFRCGILFHFYYWQ